MVYLYLLLFFGPPIGFVIYEIVSLIRSLVRPGTKRKLFFIDTLIPFTGFFLSEAYLGIFYQVEMKPWNVQLYNSQLHQTLSSDHFVVLFVLILVYILCICLNGFFNVNKIPPLVTVLMLSGLYIGPVISTVYAFHVYRGEMVLDFVLFIMPVCLTMTSFRMMYEQVQSFKPDESRLSKTISNPVLSFFYRILMNSKMWPVLAIVGLIPLLGLIVCILTLFGQAPDAAIKVFTETADWNFSQKIGPQNVSHDEHYLCTVAAGGHRKIVKPLRTGLRHGHRVYVNRQLQIANAFEQVLEEYTPKFHKKVRHFYDTYGFPVARLIKRKWIADFIWFLMKPLEWFFLFVLYLVDTHPEDRIAIQYTGKHKNDFVKE